MSQSLFTFPERHTLSVGHQPQPASRTQLASFVIAVHDGQQWPCATWSGGPPVHEASFLTLQTFPHHEHIGSTVHAPQLPNELQ